MVEDRPVEILRPARALRRAWCGEAGLILRKVFRQEPEVVVVAVAADELDLEGDGEGQLDEDYDELDEAEGDEE